MGVDRILDETHIPVPVSRHFQIDFTRAGYPTLSKRSIAENRRSNCAIPPPFNRTCDFPNDCFEMIAAHGSAEQVSLHFALIEGQKAGANGFIVQNVREGEQNSLEEESHALRLPTPSSIRRRGRALRAWRYIKPGRKLSGRPPSSCRDPGRRPHPWKR
jgi:hypothetical protein